MQVLQNEIETPARLARLLASFGAHVDARDHDGSTALHAAAQHGHSAAATMLLAHGADASVRTRCGDTPLHYAARGGHTALIALLLRHGADARATNVAGRTAHDVAPRAVAAAALAFGFGDAPSTSGANETRVGQKRQRASQSTGPAAERDGVRSSTAAPQEQSE